MLVASNCEFVVFLLHLMGDFVADLLNNSCVSPIFATPDRVTGIDHFKSDSMMNRDIRWDTSER